MNRMVGRNLDMHEVIFLAPTDDADLPKILSNMRKSNIKLHNDVIKSNDDDWSGSKNRSVVRTEKIANEVRKFGADYEYSASVIKSKGRSDTMAVLELLKAVGSAGASLLFKAGTLRNMSAQGLQLTDTAVNPHFHPFKDKQQFNAHAKIASNNKVNSIVFLEVVKLVRKKLTTFKG